MLVVMRDALEVSNEPFEGITPPGVDRTEELQEVVYVECHMTVGTVRVLLWMQVLNTL